MTYPPEYESNINYLTLKKNDNNIDYIFCDLG